MLLCRTGLCPANPLKPGLESFTPRFATLSRFSKNFLCPAAAPGQHCFTGFRPNLIPCREKGKLKPAFLQYAGPLFCRTFALFWLM